MIVMSNIGNKETMAKNLSYYLEKTGISQKDLAEVVGVATSTVNDWIKAKKYPRIDKIEIMADYFGILKSDLIEEKSGEHREMQEKNSTITKIIVHLRSDDDFLTLVETLHSMDADKMQAVRAMLSAFTK